MGTIEKWQLALDPEDEYAWFGTMSVQLDRDDLLIIATALDSAEYEGVIGESERNRILEKLNIRLY